MEVAGSEATPAGVRRCLIDGAWLEVPLYERDDLAVGAGLRGPALVVERFSATVVEGGWSCQVDPSGALLLEREEVG